MNVISVLTQGPARSYSCRPWLINDPRWSNIFKRESKIQILAGKACMNQRPALALAIKRLSATFKAGVLVRFSAHL